MAASPGYSGQQLPIRRWIGGFLLLMASIWLFLLIRDFYISVIAQDATANNALSFWRFATLINAIAILFGLALGWLLFRPGSPPSQEFEHKHRHRRRHSGAVAAQAAVPVAPRDDKDESVSYALPVNPQAAAPSTTADETPIDDTPGRVKIRVKRRIRERIRKKKE